MKERTKTFNRMASAVELSDEMVMMGGGSVPSAASRHHHHRSVRIIFEGLGDFVIMSVVHGTAIEYMHTWSSLCRSTA